MSFLDRQQAAKELVKKLEAFRDAPETLILALPRGGVVLGRVIADALALPLDIVVPRKIGAEFNEEYAIGAITETGDAVWNETEHALANKEYVKQKMNEEMQEATRRLTMYRMNLPPRNIKNQTVLIVDDGIATGLTMKAAIKTVKNEGAKTIVVAVPVAPHETITQLEALVDRVFVLDKPLLFLGSIGASYQTFEQVTDEEVIRLLK